MKKFIGTKEVLAELMMEGIAYSNGWARKGAFVDDNHNGREGYHVQYVNPDGSTYDSWSPKDVFEKSYKPSETFKERVQIERDELAVKVEKLRTFLDKANVEMEIGTKQYNFLTKQFRLLIKQLTYMENYLAILDIRLEDFK